jgi:hypothetical protein
MESRLSNQQKEAPVLAEDRNFEVLVTDIDLLDIPGIVF